MRLLSLTVRWVTSGPVPVRLAVIRMLVRSLPWRLRTRRARPLTRTLTRMRPAQTFIPLSEHLVLILVRPLRSARAEPDRIRMVARGLPTTK